MFWTLRLGDRIIDSVSVDSDMPFGVGYWVVWDSLDFRLPCILCSLPSRISGIMVPAWRSYRMLVPGNTVQFVSLASILICRYFAPLQIY